MAESRQKSTFVNIRCKGTKNRLEISTFAKNGLHLSNLSKLWSVIPLLIVLAEVILVGF
jgi:hypothetical protein